MFEFCLGCGTRIETEGATIIQEERPGRKLIEIAGCVHHISTNRREIQNATLLTGFGHTTWETLTEKADSGEGES